MMSIFTKKTLVKSVPSEEARKLAAQLLCQEYVPSLSSVISEKLMSTK